jgi:hypothetical protein
MNTMPNRYYYVADLCMQNAANNNFTLNGEKVAFPQGPENDAYRLTFLTTVVIPHLNTLDNGEWGLCTKTEQGNKVPCDILMWRSTRELVDCLTGVGAAWQTFSSPPPDSWVWTPVDGSVPPVQPPITPVPPTLAYNEGEVNGFLADEIGAYAEAGRELDAQYPIWCARMQYDAFAMGYTAARSKQLAECRKALGLPPVSI